MMPDPAESRVSDACETAILPCMDPDPDLAAARTTWLEDGYVVLPGYLPADDLAAAQRELGEMFPSGDDFHDGVDPGRNARFVGDEFDGIDGFPFASLALNRVPVSDALVTLATTLLGTTDVRLYSAEAWAKYEGAADYDQDLHRDYLNHTILVPSSDPAFGQVEMFVFLCDVTAELGAPRMVRRSPSPTPCRPGPTSSRAARPMTTTRASSRPRDGPTSSRPRCLRPDRRGPWSPSSRRPCTAAQP